MNCCEKCFKSKILTSMIQSLDKKGDCNFCESQNVYVYDLSNDSGLSEKFNELLGVFNLGVELISDGYPQYELFSLKNELGEKWNIFNGFSESKIHMFLDNLLKNDFPEKIEFLNNQVGIIEFLNQDYLKSNSILKQHSWSDFLNNIKHINRFHSNSVNYNVLKFFLTKLTSYIEDDDYFRARISNETELTIDSIGPPPPKFATAGRANSEGISHLYLGSDHNTVISEIRPSIGDTVYIGKFPVRKKLKIIDFRELKNIDVFEMEDVTKYAVNLEILRQMSDAVSKPVRSGDSKLDYLPTQFIVDYIKSLNEKESDSYDGIIFESTVSEGHNLMLFNPDIVECRIVEKRIIKSLSYSHTSQ